MSQRCIYACAVILGCLCPQMPAADDGDQAKDKDETQWKSLPYVRETSGSSDMTHPELNMQRDCRRLVDEFMSQYSPRGKGSEAAAPVLSKLERLAATYPDLRAGVQARFWKADIYARCKERAKAIEELRLVAEGYPEYPEAIQARVRWAEQSLAMGNAGGAVEVLKVVSNAGRGLPSGPLVELRYEMLIRLAEAYFRSGRRSEYEATIATIKTEFPRKTDEVTNWQTRYLESKNEDVWARHQMERLLEPENVQKSIDQAMVHDRSTLSAKSSESGEKGRNGQQDLGTPGATGTASAEGMSAPEAPAKQARSDSHENYISPTAAWWALAAACLAGVAYVTHRKLRRAR